MWRGDAAAVEEPRRGRADRDVPPQVTVPKRGQGCGGLLRGRAACGGRRTRSRTRRGVSPAVRGAVADAGVVLARDLAVHVDADQDRPLRLLRDGERVGEGALPGDEARLTPVLGGGRRPHLLARDALREARGRTLGDGIRRRIAPARNARRRSGFGLRPRRRRADQEERGGSKRGGRGRSIIVTGAAAPERASMRLIAQLRSASVERISTPTRPRSRSRRSKCSRVDSGRMWRSGRGSRPGRSASHRPGSGSRAPRSARRSTDRCPAAR